MGCNVQEEFVAKQREECVYWKKKTMYSQNIFETTYCQGADLETTAV